MADPEELAAAVEKSLRQVREVRERRGLQRQSAVNLVISDGHCIVATRFAFDYGWYHEGWTFAGGERRYDYTTLWYAAGTGYGMPRRSSGASGPGDPQTSLIVASEPLTHDRSAWLEAPEYCLLVAAPGEDAPGRRHPGARCLTRTSARRWRRWTCSRAPTPRCSTRLATLAHPFSLAAGEYLFREGDPGDRISLLASGGLEASLRLPGGRELEVEPLGAGAVDRRDGGAGRARPRRYSARASEATSGWSFAAADIGRLGVADEPEVMRRLGRLALDRLREQYERLAGRLRARTPAPRTSRARRPSSTTPGRWSPVDREPGETAYLETVLFFSHFTAAEIEELFGDLRRLEAPRGATVIAAGEQREPRL